MSNDPDPRLHEIQARLSAARERVATAEEKREMSRRTPDPIFNAGMVLAIQASSMDVSPLIADVAFLLAELRKAHEALARVEALAGEWETFAGPGSEAERALGPQKVSVGYATAKLRAAVAAANGDGQ